MITSEVSIDEYRALRHLIEVLGDATAQSAARLHLLNGLVREVQGR